MKSDRGGLEWIQIGPRSPSARRGDAARQNSPILAPNAKFRQGYEERTMRPWLSVNQAHGNGQVSSVSLCSSTSLQPL